MADDPLDAYESFFGGVSTLLESDEVMEALQNIKVAGEDFTMADVLTKTAQNLADLRAHVRKFLQDG